MNKRNNYQRLMRSVAWAAGLLLLAAILPELKMRVGALALDAHAAAPQIPVQIPVKKKPGESKEIPQIGGTKKVRVNLVRLYVTVRDKQNAIVTGLQKNDFHVYEDGVEQKIAFFSKDMTDPLTIAMMIDTSGSQEDFLDAEKATAWRFLKDILQKNDLASVISFDTTVNMLTDFTDYDPALHAAIDKAEINAPVVSADSPVDPPGTVLYDAINQVCEYQMPQQTGRKALIILTDAEDEGSTSTLKSAIYAAQKANAVIHVLLIANPAIYWGSFSGYIGGEVAHEMAYQTGGRVISIRNGKDLDKAFTELAQELRSQYVLAYYPTNTAANGAFRKVKVETTQKGLKVLTRAGYYAPTHGVQ